MVISISSTFIFLMGSQYDYGVSLEQLCQKTRKYPLFYSVYIALS